MVRRTGAKIQHANLVCGKALPIITSILMHVVYHSINNGVTRGFQGINLATPISQVMSSCTLSNHRVNVDTLQSRWAGGSDIWSSVPYGNKFISLTTRTRSLLDDKILFAWPPVVQTSILYGFGAANPRGIVATNQYNIEHHTLLKSDIVEGLEKRFPVGTTAWWEASSKWEDGSLEQGFIVAFNREMLAGTYLESGKDWVLSLAEKYQQGAIYEFQYDSATDRMNRQTVAVLDVGTDALVEIVIDSLEVKGD